MAAGATDEVPDSAKASPDAYARMMHNLSLGLLIGCPLLIALPPRKLDLYTFGLCGAFVLSANHIITERSGSSILSQASAHSPRVFQELPSEKATALQESLRRKKQDEASAKGEQEKRGLMKRLWLGEESDDWKEERMRKEREAAAEDKGFGYLIMEHFREVFSGGNKEKEKEEGKEFEGMKNWANTKDAVGDHTGVDMVDAVKQAPSSDPRKKA